MFYRVNTCGNFLNWKKITSPAKLIEFSNFSFSYIFDDTESESEEYKVIFKSEEKSTYRSKKDFKRSVRYFERQRILYASDGLNVKKNMGANKMRRVENGK